MNTPNQQAHGRRPREKAPPETPGDAPQTVVLLTLYFALCVGYFLLAVFFFMNRG